MKKVCTRCKQERDVSQDFAWRDKERGIRNTRCKYCQSELGKTHYQNNKQTYIERARIRKDITLLKNKPLLFAYLSTHPCVNCRQADIRVLEFDHVDGQKFGEISDLLRQGFSWATIEIEIAKCEVRCANCHRLKTLEHSKSWRSLTLDQQKTKSYQMTYNYLSTHPCVDCGEANIHLLEFDHVLGQKIKDVSRLLAQRQSWSLIETEISKCEVRCANCHRIKTFERDGDWWRGEDFE